MALTVTTTTLLDGVHSNCPVLAVDVMLVVAVVVSVTVDVVAVVVGVVKAHDVNVLGLPLANGRYA